MDVNEKSYDEVKVCAFLCHQQFSIVNVHICELILGGGLDNVRFYQQISIKTIRTNKPAPFAVVISLVGRSETNLNSGYKQYIQDAPYIHKQRKPRVVLLLR